MVTTAAAVVSRSVPSDILVFSEEQLNDPVAVRALLGDIIQFTDEEQALIGQMTNLYEGSVQQQFEGLQREKIDSFEILQYNNGEGYSKDVCSICIEEWQEGAQIMRLPCNHIFHPTCISTWFHRSTTCPLCKEDFI